MPAAARALGWRGFIAWRWRATWPETFDALSAGGRPRVPPILQEVTAGCLLSPSTPLKAAPPMIRIALPHSAADNHPHRGEPVPRHFTAVRLSGAGGPLPRAGKGLQLCDAGGRRLQLHFDRKQRCSLPAATREGVLDTPWGDHILFVSSVCSVAVFRMPTSSFLGCASLYHPHH